MSNFPLLVMVFDDILCVLIHPVKGLFWRECFGFHRNLYHDFHIFYAVLS